LITDGFRESTSAPMTMDPTDYGLLPPDLKPVFDEWMEELIGEPLEGAHVVTATLGEGVVEVERYRLKNGKPYVDGNGDVPKYTKTYRSHRPPPVWKVVSRGPSRIRPSQ
jgi:hypothetical protein